MTTIEEQLRRTYAQYSRSPSPLSKFILLAQLRDRNEVLFYRLLSEHLEEMLPIVYTPTIGEAIERFSHEYTGARGVFLSIDHPELRARPGWAWPTWSARRWPALGCRHRRPTGSSGRSTPAA